MANGEQVLDFSQLTPEMRQFALSQQGLPNETFQFGDGLAVIPGGFTPDAPQRPTVAGVLADPALREQVKTASRAALTRPQKEAVAEARQRSLAAGRRAQRSFFETPADRKAQRRRESDERALRFIRAREVEPELAKGRADFFTELLKNQRAAGRQLTRADIEGAKRKSEQKERDLKVKLQDRKLLSEEKRADLDNETRIFVAQQPLEKALQTGQVPGTPQFWSRVAAETENLLRTKEFEAALDDRSKLAEAKIDAVLAMAELPVNPTDRGAKRRAIQQIEAIYDKRASEIDAALAPEEPAVAAPEAEGARQAEGQAATDVNGDGRVDEKDGQIVAAQRSLALKKAALDQLGRITDPTKRQERQKALQQEMADLNRTISLLNTTNKNLSTQ